MQLRRAIGTLAPARIGRCRCYAAQRAPPELAPAELIDSWMADSRLVSDSLGFFGLNGNAFHIANPAGPRPS